MTKSTLKNITLESIPLKMKHNTDISNLNDLSTVAVAVQYCVLRPKTKKYT